MNVKVLSPVLSSIGPSVARVGAVLLVLAGVGQTPLLAQTRPDWGDIRLTFMPPTTPAEQEVLGYLNDRSFSYLHDLVFDINDSISLGDDIEVRFFSLPGSEPIATYDSDRNLALISYQYVLQIARLFEGDVQYWYPNIEQVMLHEIGHALIDVNEIPLFENSEVAADALAFFILSEFYNDHEQLLSVALRYDLRALENAGPTAIPNSPHIPDAQRANAYKCWVEGKTSGRGECFQWYSNLFNTFSDRLAPFWIVGF